MSNDDKTLADMQPGGRVRLGNQAERARYEAWGRMEGLPLARAKLGGYAFEVTAKAWLAWQHLSARPSPGGQGDALVEAAMIIANAAHDRALMSNILSGMRAHEAQSLKSAILALDAALAARQAVYVQGCDELRARTGGERAAYMEGLEEGKKIAARQPVGEPITVEAVAEIFNHPEYGLSIDWLLENGIGELQVGDVLMVSDRAITDEDGSGEVYTGPPAQAVDLGEVCALLQRRIEQWRSHLPADPGAPGTREIETKGEHDYNNDVRIYREGIAVMEEVLSKIDGQAVGNG